MPKPVGTSGLSQPLPPTHTASTEEEHRSSASKPPSITACQMVKPPTAARHLISHWLGASAAARAHTHARAYTHTYTGTSARTDLESSMSMSQPSPPSFAMAPPAVNVVPLLPLNKKTELLTSCRHAPEPAR